MVSKEGSDCSRQHKWRGGCSTSVSHLEEVFSTPQKRSSAGLNIMSLLPVRGVSPHSLRTTGLNPLRLMKLYLFLLLMLVIICFCSCFYIAWLVSSVFGAYRPVNVQERRSLPSFGDLMAKVRNNHKHVQHPCFFWCPESQSWFILIPVLAFSLGDTKQVVLCGVEKAEILHMFPMHSPVTCMNWMEVTEESR